MDELQVPSSINLMKTTIEDRDRDGHVMTREVSKTPALLGKDMDGAVAAVTRYRYHIQEIAQVVSGWLNVGCVTVRKLLRDTQFVTQLEPRRRSVVSPSPLAGSLLRRGCLGAGVRFPSEINNCRLGFPCPWGFLCRHPPEPNLAAWAAPVRGWVLQIKFPCQPSPIEPN